MLHMLLLKVMSLISLCIFVLFALHNLFRQLFTPTKYISAYILNVVTLTVHQHVTFLVLFGRYAILPSQSLNLVDLLINPLP